MSRSKEILTRGILFSVRKILSPLVRILLRNGIPYGSFADLAKGVYVDVASREFGIPGRKQSTSRISVLTGLSRKEVTRILTLPSPDEGNARETYNRAARVISGWIRDRRFSDGKGNPHILPVEGEKNSFKELVKAFSGDVPARAVLDELIRVHAVTLTDKGEVQLLARAYIPNKDDRGKLHILGTDVSDLISTIDNNLIGSPRRSRFQRKVCYDNLPLEVLPELQDMTDKEAQKLLEKFDRWMSKRDRDVNPKATGTKRMRAGVGIYYFENELQEEDNEDET